MQITKLSSVDAFVVTDIPEAESATGIVRCARKILQDGAENLARSVTYAYAALSITTSGASAGINAEGDAVPDAIDAFVSELSETVASGSLRLDAAKGVEAGRLAPWSLSPPVANPERYLTAGVIAAAGAAVGDLSGLSVGVEDGAPHSDLIAAAFTSEGCSVMTAPLSELGAPESGPRAVTVVGSKTAVLDHDNVSALGATCIVGAAPLSITARGLAVAGRNGATVLADFVSSAGVLLAALEPSDSPEEIEAAVGDKIASAISAAQGHEHGPFLGACFAAEAFLATWATDLPFGRPLP